MDQLRMDHDPSLGASVLGDAPGEGIEGARADPGLPQPVAANQERRPSRRRRQWRFEASDESEEWVISYMDMVTLIMCAFVVIAALLDLQSSHAQQPPFMGATGGPGAVAVDVAAIEPLEGTPGATATFVVEAAPARQDQHPAAAEAGPPAALDPSAVRAEAQAVDSSKAGAPESDAKIEEAWRSAVAAQGLDGRVTISARGRIVTMQIQDEILFPTGDSDLQPGGREVIRRIAPLLARAGGDIRVEGHTDNVPIDNERFASNWDLSAARATSVVRALVDAGIGPARLRATGYADTRPEQPNDTDAGRAHNRRVALLIEQ